MYKILLSLSFLFFATLALAQTTAASEKNDPEAKKVLDKIRKKYDAFKTLEASFTLSIEVPNQPVEAQKGVVVQSN